MRRGQAALEYFILFAVIVVLAVAMLLAYSKGEKQKALEDYISGGTAGTPAPGMKLSSPAFENNAFIPVKFTCQGNGVNPELIIGDVSTGAKSLALVVFDPDAPGGDFVHWVVYDIPVTNRIEKNSIPGKQGINSAGNQNYEPPCPPSGVHRYVFKIYALDEMLNLDSGLSKIDLEKAMSGHILNKTKLIGLYENK